MQRSDAGFPDYGITPPTPITSGRILCARWEHEMKNKQLSGILNGASRTWWKQTIARSGMTIIATAFAVVAAYLGTINDLKLALAEKADRRAVEQIEVRLSRIEVLLTEQLLTKDEFRELRDELLLRLARIENELE